ncbi:MAG TPA: flagellar protein FlaG [Clostridiales bacterium]|nr:flagellar protein FlaG [Clostridiales bacterium]
MKVNSMDAGNVRFSTVDEITRGSAIAKVTEVNMSKTESINKNALRLTEFERRELPVSERIVIDAIERANEAVSIANRRFEYSIHEKTKHIMVKVIDIETEEIVREIPPEKILDLVAMIWEMTGLLVDERR